jgi:hypothetical protein
MSATRKPKPSRERVKEYRARMKRKGMRLVQFWVPDVRTPEFAAEAHRQSLAVARSAQEEDDLAFIESIAEPFDDE